MHLGESFRSAVHGLRTNILRSVLTALGIIIGVAAVITLIAVGQGAQDNITAEIGRLGTDLIIVSPRSQTQLRSQDALDLVERVPTIVRAVPIQSMPRVQVNWGSQSFETQVQGVGIGYDAVASLDIDQGRFFLDGEVGDRVRVALVGPGVVENLFRGQSPMGEFVRFQGQRFTVIGVLGPQGSQMGQNADDVILIPVTTMQRISQSQRLSMIYVQAAGPDVAGLASSHIRSVMNQKTGRENAVSVTSQEQILDIVRTITGTFTIMLAAIAGISLVVGGIGIMNIMLVSVKERTREIGIRKAVGARQRDILAQFMVESVLLSVVGGCLGIALGWVLTRLILLFGLTPTITLGSVALAFGFSAAVGLFFGVYPAFQAARMDPIQALRYG